MNDKRTYYRLIALWVVCEAFLGGIIHGLKLPVSGLVVGSAAIICISLIGYFYNERMSILRATIIVAIFKMMLSPQSPFMAYIAVLFQGLLGQLIFMNRKNFKTRCIIFSIIALIESGFQRLIIMTIVSGTDIWEVTDRFIGSLIGQSDATGISYWIAGSYVLMHLIAGLMVGILAGRIPSLVLRNQKSADMKIDIGDAEVIVNEKKSRRFKWLPRMLLCITAVLVIHSSLYPQQALIPETIISKLILRTTLFILVWITLINPILMLWLKQWLERRKTNYVVDMKEITLLLPAMKLLVARCWRQSSSRKHISRLNYFFKLVVLNSLNHDQ